MAKEATVQEEETAKDVAVSDAKGTGVAVSGEYDYGEDAGAGFEGTKGSDLSVPFISILQSNSPQIENDDPAGCRPGMLFNTVTRELIAGDQGVPFLPCHKEGPVWVEWIPRSKGKGFVGLHDPESDEVKDAPFILNDEGKPTRKKRLGENELIETYYMYGLLLAEDMVTTKGFAVVSFTSTKIKPYRDSTTAMFTLRPEGATRAPPLFANRLRFKTVKVVKDGNTFYNFTVDPLNGTWIKSLIPNNSDHAVLMAQAKEFREMVVSGMARASFETEQSTGDSDAPAPEAGEDDAPPF